MKVGEQWPTTPLLVKSHPKSADKFSKTKSTFTNLLSLEVELEQVQIAKDIGLWWTHTEDGSLRNNGREFKTEGAVPLSELNGALYYLMSDRLSGCSASPRTSTHVHMHVRELTLDQLAALLWLYMACEESLFKYAGKNRFKSIFCVPVWQTSLWQKPLMHIIGSRRISWHKYTALNLLTLQNFNTLEFRHYPGLTDVEHFTEWLHILARMYNLVVAKPLGEIQAMTIRQLSNALNLNVLPRDHEASLFLTV